MITERDLREAIAECEGCRNPSASTCIKLAAYYTILNNLNHDSKKDSTDDGYSYQSGPSLKYSDTEFSRIVQGKGIERCFPVIDEIMSALLVCNPKLYNSAVRQLEDV